MAAEVDPGVTAENPARDLIDAFIAHEAILLSPSVKRKSNSVLKELSLSIGTVCAYVLDGAFDSQVAAQIQYSEESIQAMRSPGVIADGDIKSHLLLDLAEAELEIIKARHNPDDLSEAREWLNDTTYYWLGNLCERASEDGAQRRTHNSIGFVTEMTLLALINRDLSSDVLIMPALPHHETRQVSSHKNYDQVLVTREEIGMGTAKIQVKRACIGLAPGHQVETDRPRKYVSEIVFASGCCDLRIGWDPETYEMDLTIPEALLANKDPKPATHINRYLGGLAQSFLETVDLPLRAGDLKLAEAA